MRIGITERGDASRDFQWIDKLNTVDGAILITKNLTDKFIYHVLRCDKPVIIHVTCTGYGGTELEPNVPDYKKQIANAVELINKGFPVNCIVLRIDPILPTQKGLTKLSSVLDEYQRTLYYMGVDRIRVSILDEYKHVKQRFIEHGWYSIYGDSFQPSDQQVMSVAQVLESYSFNFETCAESKLASCSNASNIQELGCVSMKDLDCMGINYDGLAMYENPQNRKGCHCLSWKTELLTNKCQCPNGCVYCYWR